VLVSREVAADGARLKEKLATSGATVLQATPATWRLLLSAGWKNDGTLKMLCGGEALQSELAAQLLESGADLWNLYGPTETTIWSTIQKVDSAADGGYVTIGRPIANTQVYVLDRHMQPVPVGVAGELYIGGRGVSLGYLNRADLTSERFLANPFSDDLGSVIYRTGDLVRYLADGTLQYLNRIDNQVKIRGFRIELGDIEAVLAEHDALRENVVVAREDKSGGKRLVAYLVAKEEAPSVQELREYLKGKLPEYMVPSAFVVLDALPLTPNGKVDRRALPEPGRERPELSVEFVAPQTPLEKELAAIWIDLFGSDRIGVNDNFFELGGHSLLATQLGSRLRERFQVEIPLYHLFRNATVTGLAQLIEEYAGQEDDMQQLPDIKPVSRDVEIPLSFSQERVWFVEQLNPFNKAYYFNGTLRFTGEVNVPAMERALTDIMERHEIFRTSFPAKDGKPYQQIHPAEPVKLDVIDIEWVEESKREAELKRLIDEEIGKSIDIAKLPIVRFSLFRLSEKEYVYLHVEHHLVHDGWSFRIFLRDFLLLYKAHSEGKQAKLPEMPVQFADFAYWHREYMQGAHIDKQLDYWVKKLEGATKVLELPTDRPRPAVHKFRGTAPRVKFDRALTTQLVDFCRKEGVTMYMVLMAAFQTLMHRYSGQKDLIVGTGIANRRWAETEQLLGMLVNNVMLHSDFSNDPTFRDHLHHVRNSAWEAYENQDVPFERVVEALKLDRDLSRNPLYQVMFSFHDTPIEKVDLPAKLELTEVVSNGSSKFDFNVIVIPRTDSQDYGIAAGQMPDDLVLLWEYNTDLWDEETIQNIMKHFQQLLGSIVQNPDEHVSRLSLLNEQEREQQLVLWNETEAPYPNVCLHNLFEEQAQKTPDAVAAIFGEQEMTYAELDRRANQLAHHLIKLGVGPDVPVGLCMDRSLEMVVGLVGVLKAGGAFVPLDTEAPTARILQVVEDAQAPVVVSQSSLQHKLPVEVKHYVYLDQAAELEAYPTTAPQVDVQPHHLCSIYYTSGSTGKPKGVSNTHVGWVNRMVWMQDYHKLTADESVLQKTTLTFDDAGVEFFWPLMVGARIALLEPGLHKDPRAIIDAAIKYQVSLLQFVPSMLTLIVDAITPEDRNNLKRLRIVVSSGEALRAELVRKFRDRVGCGLFNLWGATEVSIDSTQHACTVTDALEGAIVPVGTPIANNQVYVLDQHMQPVPIGVAGDLYLAGIGLARDYLNNPERTAEAFVPNPYVEGERMYKTGDRGYYRRDGSVMFLGRLDDQVKVRGQRVELGEMEAVLAQHPAVKDCAVVAHKYPDGYRVAGYYVLQPEPANYAGEYKWGAVESLRAFMNERLPDYMVPARFMQVEEMPLTTSGKIDRKLLPEFSDERPELASSYVAPRNELESAIVDIWQTILNLSQIGVEDKFFDLGGHSLDATRVISRVNRDLEVSLPLRVLFEEPTVAGMAKAVEKLRAEGGDSKQTSIPRLPRKEAYELSRAQRRFWFQYQYDPQNAFGATFADELDGPLDTEAFLKAWQALVNRHGIMRTTFAERSGTPFQIVHDTWENAIGFADFSELSAEERQEAVALRVQQEMETPFHLGNGPLFRTTLFKLAEGKHLLLRSVHPIAYDSWSTGVLMKDLSALYSAFKSGASANDLPAALQYVDYAAWQNQRLAAGDLNGQKDYWATHLEGFQEPAMLPNDEAYEPAPMVIRNAVIGKELTEKLRELSNAQGGTMFWTLLSGL
ncbi:MAG: amino acid adenylation domain-containing protein, partial [Tumebacillaceae bacterium]